MEIVKEFRNDLLKRKEMVFSGEYSGNPGFVKAAEDVATETGVSEKVIVVRNVKGEFGSGEFVIDVFVYDSVEDKKKIEPKKKEKKK